ncbi:hypothetical protein [uncultured Microbacterium sp.]|uniref:hypothetical protein n=1 Tax=uncultured Microbacterium sp. TaxID=191216 RepID=UPI0035C96352
MTHAPDDRTVHVARRLEHPAVDDSTEVSRPRPRRSTAEPALPAQEAPSPPPPTPQPWRPPVIVERAHPSAHAPQPVLDGAAIALAGRRAARRRALAALAVVVALVAASAVLLVVVLSTL